PPSTDDAPLAPPPSLCHGSPLPRSLSSRQKSLQNHETYEEKLSQTSPPPSPSPPPPLLRVGKQQNMVLQLPPHLQQPLQHFRRRLNPSVKGRRSVMNHPSFIITLPLSPPKKQTHLSPGAFAFFFGAFPIRLLVPTRERF